MLHKREDVIARAERAFAELDQLISGLSADGWQRPLARPESKDPWTVKDALAHITYWRANMARSLRKERRPEEQRGLDANAVNHIIYLRWRDKPPEEVLTWHRQAQAEIIAALRAVPDEYFSGRERSPQWPYDLVGHVSEHLRKDIEKALKA